MKAGWKTVKLSDVCDIVKGRKPNLRPTPNKGDLPYLVARYIRGLEEPEYGSPTEKGIVTLTEDDTVIICDGSNSGEIFTGLNGIMSSTMGKVVKKTEIHDPYLRHFLASTFELFNGTKTGSAIPHLDKEAFRKLEIPLPPLAEQKRIVALLDEAFASIDEAKAKAVRCLTDAEESFNSLIDSKISCASEGVPCVPLEELCDNKRVITYGVIKLGEPTRDGVYCLRCGNLKRLTIDLEGIRKIPDSLSKEYSRTVLRGGELLINVRGTLGGVCVAPSSMSGWNVAREIAVVPLQPGEMSAEYLSYHVASTTSQTWLMGKRKGAAYVGINIEDIRRLPIYLPSKKEQGRIAGVLSEAQRHARDLQNIYEKKAKKLLDLKSSLLTQAFAGELTA